MKEESICSTDREEARQREWGRRSQVSAINNNTITIHAMLYILSLSSEIGDIPVAISRRLIFHFQNRVVVGRDLQRCFLLSRICDCV